MSTATRLQGFVPGRISNRLIIKMFVSSRFDSRLDSPLETRTELVARILAVVSQERSMSNHETARKILSGADVLGTTEDR